MPLRHSRSASELPSTLQELYARMADLSAAICPEVSSFVPAEGDAKAKLCLIGEAPAEYEVRAGRPFTGPAGRLLDEALAAVGLVRGQIWLTNVAKCRAVRVVKGRKENRPLTAGELKAWTPLLEEELRIVRPAAIVCLGATAARAVLGKPVKLTEQRGEWFDSPSGARVIMTFHPAYVLHLQTHAPDRSGVAYDTLLADLAAARDALKEAVRSPLSGPQVRQPSLFDA